MHRESEVLPLNFFANNGHTSPLASFCPKVRWHLRLAHAPWCPDAAHCDSGARTSVTDVGWLPVVPKLSFRGIGQAGEGTGSCTAGREEAGGSWTSGRRMSRLRRSGLRAGAGCVTEVGEWRRLAGSGDLGQRSAARSKAQLGPLCEIFSQEGSALGLPPDLHSFTVGLTAVPKGGGAL